jgi:sensor histidine kinase YesM
VSDSVLEPGYRFSLAFIFFITQNLFLFYGFLFFLKKFSKLEILKSLSRLLLFLFSFLIVRYYARYYFIPQFIEAKYGNVPLLEFFMGGMVWTTNYFFYASAYFYFQSSIQKQKDLLKSQEEKLIKEKETIQLEKENLQLENTALRAQINPHFLYNTLDFLYAKALPVSDELSDGVMKLSDIMRYSLKPQDAEGLVYLTDEAEHIQNIIEMNQLRFDNRLNIIYSANDIAEDIKIIPLVLITMVENVFKHGVTNNPEHAVRITLAVNEQDQLHFSTSNKKRIGPKEHSTGIGLNNTLKRLSNTYGDRCTVTVADEEHFFTVKLQIQLFKGENNVRS